MAKSKITDGIKCPVCDEMNEVVDWEHAWFYKSLISDVSGHIEYKFFCQCGCEYIHTQEFKIEKTSTHTENDPRGLDELESEAE